MTLVLNGTNGVSDVDGSASTPAIRGTDTNTGIFFPAADTIAFAEGGAEVARFDSSGNLGIGTSSPTAKIGIPVPDYSVSSTAGMIRFQNPNVSADSCIQSFYVASAGSDLWLGANSYVDTSGNTARFNASYASSFIDIRRDGSLQFGTNTSSGVATERARIDSSGNLLVGTNSNFAGSGTNIVCSSNANCISANTTAASGTGWYLFSGYSNAPNVNSVGTLRFRVTDNGNVSNTNNSYGAISDAKLKENVTDATPKLEKLNQVRVVNFNIIGDTQKQIGVIAQELEQIFPGMVEETPDRDEEGNDLGTTTKSVKYSVFVPMLIKAIQEQQALIESLTARIAALEAA